MEDVKKVLTEKDLEWLECLQAPVVIHCNERRGNRENQSSYKVPEKPEIHSFMPGVLSLCMHMSPSIPCENRAFLSSTYWGDL